MRKTSFFLLLLIFFSSIGLGFSNEPKLSSNSILGQQIGKDWQDPHGFVIDDLNGAMKGVKDPTFNQYQSMGVTALASFDYRKISNPLDQVTVKIFVFESEAKRQAWTNKKYGHEGWEKFYKKTQDGKMTIWDSTEISKRIIASGKFWITSQAISSSSDYLDILSLYLDKFALK